MSLRRRLSGDPFATAVAGSAIALGTVGMVIGERVSQGMTNSLAGQANAVAHVWGLMLAAGGVLVLCGHDARRSTLELPGLYLVTGGYAFYCTTVLTGLGTHGLAAGLMSGALAGGCLLKAREISVRARAVQAVPPVPVGGEVP
ncbi:hypothetical protein [Actinomadura flavalba]|uniref:hypothetical protein n=1 Tax=Actinomadura flavalba TaxID=1120938 RepID=UPI0003638606|nr:hypothetical protein [Actinomadura flavalba]